MALGTLESSPPPFFKQGPSAFTKLIFFSALSALLIFADVRYTLIQPIRWSLSMVLFPVQWMARQPIELWEGSIQYFESRDNAQAQVASSKIQLLKLSVRATQVEQLQLENQQLRQLLALSERQNSSGVIAQVIYDAPDPYTRKFILNKGSAQGIKRSSPVMDELGILGQITRVYPLVSEATLVIDKEHSIPVLNTRTGARGVAFGEAGGAPLMELRYMATNADIEVGDILTTSGVDGVYPAGVMVAKVSKVERRADTVFARILCEPLAHAQGARLVMVLEPVGTDLPPRPAAEKQVPLQARGGRR